METGQVIDMSVYFKQATLWGFLYVVLPAAVIIVAILFGRRLLKKKRPEEEIKPPAEEIKAEPGPDNKAAEQ